MKRRVRKNTGALRDRERKALTELKGRLLSRFPRRIREVILFGSKARGDDHPESDIDLLILVNRLNRRMRDRIQDIAWDVEEENDFTFQLSPHVWDVNFFKELLKEERRIALDIRKEGIRI